MTDPSIYQCEDCGATRCKLWRRSNVLATIAHLRCGPCALASQFYPNTAEIGADGRVEAHALRGELTDQIGMLVPAVPTPDGTTFWSYGGVPDALVDWWRSLPSYPEPRP